MEQSRNRSNAGSGQWSKPLPKFVSSSSSSSSSPSSSLSSSSSYSSSSSSAWQAHRSSNGSQASVVGSQAKSLPPAKENSQEKANHSEDSSSDCESEEENSADPMKASDALESSIFKGYLSNSNHGDSLTEAAGLLKIRNLLLASKSGAISCLICLEKVRATHQVWDCKGGCHAIFHLVCIQAWAQQSTMAATERSAARLTPEHFPSTAEVSWYCPKCRSEYPRSQIPREYRCFCGKVSDPPLDPWLTSHSCGDPCGKPLSGACGHVCVLLCHPGACPPCPNFVKSTCYCGAKAEVRRCGRKLFSCAETCGRSLPCGLHTCEENCHPEECPPCQKIGRHSCKCGAVSELRPCVEADFQCSQPCPNDLPCRKHKCGKICHVGPCGACELQGKRTCPCGKVEYRGAACDAVVPTCGSTCEKALPCSLHRCQERCHFGSCNTTCRILTVKSCRCGSTRKEVPCYQDLQCERKCQRMRNCLSHPCKRRCCDGDCPPCLEVCGRKLRCGNHKCPAPCHRGSCAPCPVSVRISCACGATGFEVPCGTERDLKPPRCPKQCQIPQRCSHGIGCKPHRCHYGACPPCRLTCGEELSCGHKCKVSCHGPRPLPNPEYSLKKQKKQKFVPIDERDLGKPCPPCSELLVKSCLGKHPGGERTITCSQNFEFGCGKLCGNPLACGNHFCQKPCHKITVLRGANLVEVKDTISSTAKDGNTNSNIIDFCVRCTLPCQKERESYCPHPCPNSCHPGDCSPCKVLIKRACHCGTLVKVFECSWFHNLSKKDCLKELSCGGPCHRKLPHCTHLCPDLCHPGPCKTATSCKKKVTVRCPCQRLKKEWICLDVRSAYNNIQHKENVKSVYGVGLIPCNEECLRLEELKRLRDNADHLHQRKSNTTEDLLPNKVRRHRRMNETNTHESRYQNLKIVSMKVLRKFLVVLIFLFLVCALYYGYKGLLRISDWMNEIDAARPRKKPPGSFL